VVKICTVIVLSLARFIGADVMPTGVDEVEIPSFAANKIFAAFYAVYMLAAVT
jgi:hypothetical protein